MWYSTIVIENLGYLNKWRRFGSLYNWSPKHLVCIRYWLRSALNDFDFPQNTWCLKIYKDAVIPWKDSCKGVISQMHSKLLLSSLVSEPMRRTSFTTSSSICKLRSCRQRCLRFQCSIREHEKMHTRFLVWIGKKTACLSEQKLFLDE